MDRSWYLGVCLAFGSLLLLPHESSQGTSFSLSVSSGESLLPCVYRGVPYLHGESWKADECTTCTCDNATATCEIESCPPALCPEPIKPEGECCFRCLEVSSFSLSVSSGELLLPCVYRDIPYLHGESWKADECTTCTCHNATTTCVIESCQPAFCPKPIKPEGECCIRCPKGPELPCIYTEMPYLHGESWKVDECTTCTCDDATVSCEIESCEPALCPEPIKPEGECCFRCPQGTSFSQSFPSGIEPLPCIYREIPYLHGESWKADECTPCTCDDATVTCVIETCQAVLCPKPIKPEGECCFKCPKKWKRLFSADSESKN